MKATSGKHYNTRLIDSPWSTVWKALFGTIRKLSTDLALALDYPGVMLTL